MLIKSISTRLLVISVCWAVLALGATGVVLSSAFRETVEQRFDETLSVYLSILLGQLAEVRQQGFGSSPPELSEPRFVLPLSGWYWMVLDANSGELLLASESLAGDAIDVADGITEIPPGRLYQRYINGPAGDQLRLVARRVAFEDGRWLVVAVAGLAGTIDEDTTRFVRQLVAFLSVFAAVLVGAIYLQWRVGLQPLTKLRSELEAVREGTVPLVRGRFPSEIAPVADALNTLIASNQATLARARQHVGNLAHALKTPLSILMNDAARPDENLPKSVREQTWVMQRQIRYYLGRAQIAARERVIGTVTDIVPVLQRLHRAMSRLAARRGVMVRLQIPISARFAGEQQDFEEIVGNLVDNAIKWASSEVEINVSANEHRPRGNRAATYVYLTISDDGPGLDPEERSAALSRGGRLDQSKPGSGLGLSIVSELVELYGGTLEFGRSEAGGLCVRVALPRA